MNQIYTENAPAAVGPYSQAVVVNGMVYTSGQIALDPKTGEHYIALFNLKNEEQLIFVSREECKVMFPDGYFTADTEKMVEVWSQNLITVNNDIVGANVKPHGTALFHAV